MIRTSSKARKAMEAMEEAMEDDEDEDENLDETKDETDDQDGIYRIYSN